jgi:hypothetical protein
LSNPIGKELKIGPKSFKLEVKTKVCQNDLILCGTIFAPNFLGLSPTKYSIQFLNETYFLRIRCTLIKYLSRYKRKKKTVKYEGLIEDIKARGWKVDPLLVLTAGARGSTHKTTIYALKNLYTIPKTLIEPMVSQLNTNAIKYAMNILLYKRKLENNQLVPIIPN